MNRLIEYIKENDKLNGFLRDNKDLIIKVAAVALVIAVAFIIFSIKGNSQEVTEVNDNIKTQREESVKIFVDIGGEVKSPMLAQLKEGSRVEDAINAAGGLTENADLTDINRAAFVNDGDKIFIPSRVGDGFDESGDSQGGSSGVYSDGKININTADSSQLQQLTGVGPVTAEKIISYREENGRFSSIEDIKNVSGIGDKTYEKLKSDIRV